MEGNHAVPAGAVEAARRVLRDRNRVLDRAVLVESVASEGFDAETARRAVQRLAVTDDATITADTVRFE